MKFFLSLILILFTSNAYSADVSIEMLNKNKETKKRMVYSEELVKINVGQTIDWLPTAKGHNVEMLIGPDGYDLPKKSKLSDKVSLTFSVPGIYLYQCSPHAAMGMIGIVVVGDDVSNKDAVAKKKLTGSKSKKKLKKLLAEI
ncbi:MAG: pseudoazurin [Rickettsiales bacterium]|nr:pseudoazurin [Rickettsiales bacterium]